MGVVMATVSPVVRYYWRLPYTKVWMEKEEVGLVEGGLRRGERVRRRVVVGWEQERVSVERDWVRGVHGTELEVMERVVVRGS